MFMNLHTPPAGKALYSVYVTEAPVGTPADEIWMDEIDVVLARNANVAHILHAAAEELAGYEGCRVVGIINQSDGYVVAALQDGDLLKGR